MGRQHNESVIRGSCDKGGLSPFHIALGRLGEACHPVTLMNVAALAGLLLLLLPLTEMLASM
eukprot:2647004-Amphidinium_carterae.1